MSTAAIPVHIALVDQSGEISLDDLVSCAGALNEQIQADFAPVWKVAASVGAYPGPTPPVGTWAVIVQKSLDQPGALGYHTDDNNQPVSYVEFTQDWTVTASHEILEMLADPWGNRMHSAILPYGMEIDYVAFGLAGQHDRVHYLLEVADPCESTQYLVGGVDLSDFLTPYWYRTEMVGCSEHYSHAGGCIHPRQVANGGYVSFSNDAGNWFQVFNENGAMSIRNLGKFSRSSEFGSLREFADHHAREYRANLKAGLI